jgi:hypothetical protein
MAAERDKLVGKLKVAGLFRQAHALWDLRTTVLSKNEARQAVVVSNSRLVLFRGTLSSLLVLIDMLQVVEVVVEFFNIVACAHY